MKYKRDHTTNSSSNSFICDVCGHVESGWDMGREDAEMYECQHGHEFCFDHAEELTDEAIYRELSERLIEALERTYTWTLESFKEHGIQSEEDLKNLDTDHLREIYKDGFFELDSVPEEMCPICMLEHLDNKDVLDYVVKKYNIDLNKEKESIRSEFSRRPELVNYLKEKKS